MNRDYLLLKSVLSVPSKTYQEERMVQFLSEWFEKEGIPYYIDEFYNVYATKGISDDPEFIYPCVISHTDTVHNIDTINIREEYLPNAQKELKLSLKAYNDEGFPTGIGGDDKCGIFACLELLKELPYLKAAFFVSEETGCHGSRNSDPEFFKNVGYAIQFDAPENWMITEYCYGTQLFKRESEFFQKCDSVLKESFQKTEYMRHPYTDVQALKEKYDFQCINISIGYYDYHTRNEYVVVEDVYNGIEAGRKMIQSLGNRKYRLVPNKQMRQLHLFFD
jgi:putative aminopeptidase FrvX